MSILWPVISLVIKYVLEYILTRIFSNNMRHRIRKFLKWFRRGQNNRYENTKDGFAEYHCKKCNNKWRSRNTFSANLGEKCYKCKETVCAYKGKGLTPYQGTKTCLGFFKCLRCQKEWTTRNSQANKSEECLNCSIPVYPHKQKPNERRQTTKSMDLGGPNQLLSENRKNSLKPPRAF